MHDLCIYLPIHYTSTLFILRDQHTECNFLREKNNNELLCILYLHVCICMLASVYVYVKCYHVYTFSIEIFQICIRV